MDKFLKNGRCFLPELFEAIGKTAAPAKAQRVNILKEYVAKGEDHKAVLRAFVECVFHPAVVFELPEGEPPFKKNTGPDYTFAGSSLFSVVSTKKIRYFAKCAGLIQNEVKRQQVFIQVLESLHEKEAALFIMMKDKKITGYKYLKEDLFREAFPEWLPKVEAEKS